MKKLFLVMAVAGFVACNNSADADAEATRIADSTRVADSLAKVAAESMPVVDTTATAPAATDTTAAKK